MAKKFMYVCFGVLALMVAFHIGAQHGQAGYVQQSETGIIAVDNDKGHYVLLGNGEVWRFYGLEWGHHPDFDLPVPVSQVKFWVSPYQFYTVNNEAWFKESQSAEWVNYGAPSGGVLTEPSTWGAIKTRWRDGDD